MECILSPRADTFAAKKSGCPAHSELVPPSLNWYNSRMSYKLFDRGISPEEIRKMKLAEKTEDAAMQQLRKWRESEHVLNILRTIKASEMEFTKLEVEAWQKATHCK